jgi:hypothetical protein
MHTGTTHEAAHPRGRISDRARRRGARCLMLLMLHSSVAPGFPVLRAHPAAVVDAASRWSFPAEAVSGVRHEPAPADRGSEAEVPEDDGGPSMPEASAFEPVSGDELVDLFSGDFRYSIPLLSVGDHPITLTYHADVGANDEASWVGLGWNLNTGAVTRDVRGLPDDLMGDEVVQETHMKPREELELNLGVGFQFAGVDALKSIGLGQEMGIVHDNYEGWGLKMGLKGSTSFGAESLSGSLGLTAGIDSRSGGYLNPSMSMDAKTRQRDRSTSFGASVGFDIGSREGYKQTNFGFQVRRSFDHRYTHNKKERSQDIDLTSASMGFPLGYATPAYMPALDMSITNHHIQVHGTIGGEVSTVHINGEVEGSFSKQVLGGLDREQAYGYLYAHRSNDHALMDINRERDGPFRKEIPDLPITSFTHDVFRATGDGLSATFRPMRGDVGMVHDALKVNRTISGGAGVEIGVGNLTHVGGDIAVNLGEDRSGKWTNENDLAGVLRFTDTLAAHPLYEPVFFTCISELSPMRNEALFERFGGFDAVRAELAPPDGINTGRCTRQLSNGQAITATEQSLKLEREPRNTLISWTTIAERRERGAAWSSFTFRTPDGRIQHASLAELGPANAKKPHHIAQIDITAADGRRYAYGLPAYNLLLKEASFNVCGGGDCGGDADGLVPYQPGTDNTTANRKGNDWYFRSTRTPPHAYAWLLTAIVSEDHEDLTNDGPTPDDPGTWTRFGYKLVNPAFRWRNPTDQDRAAHQEGDAHSEDDDRGHYIYGEKEVFYLERIETRDHIALFFTSERDDALGVRGENGGPDRNMRLHKLDSIQLFTIEAFNRPDPRPMRSVHFEYDYSLAPGQPNTIDQGGKLTLRRVWFRHEGSDKGRRSPYVFHYGHNPRYEERAVDRWGRYKERPDHGPDNERFPYVEQDAARQDRHASAWLLDSLQLPSGGAIKVHYGADDYAYVQDRPAMVMCRVLGVAASPDATALSDILYEENAVNDHLFVELSGMDEADRGPDQLFRYLEGIRELYYNVKIRILATAEGGYEKLGGFLPVSFERSDYGTLYGYRGTTGRVAWIKLPVVVKDGRGETSSLPEYDIRYGPADQRHPFTQAAFELIRSRYGELVHEAYGRDYADFMVALEQFTAAFLTVFQQGEENYLFGKGRCKVIEPEGSFIRLNAANGRKLGGGARVEKLIVHDNWGRMQRDGEHPGLNYHYGSEYVYEEEGASTGVAAFEPPIGSDENPFVLPVRYRIAKALAADLNQFQMEPVGVSHFPAPSVGYAKVTVRSLQRPTDPARPSLRPRATGHVVTEFHTARDFPTRTAQTEIQSVHREVMVPLQFFNRRLNSATVSQGFVVELNDMHGRMKARRTYDAEGREVEGVDHFYQLDAEGRLDNRIRVVDPVTGQVSARLGGVDYDLVFDARNMTSNLDGQEVQLQTELFQVGPAPVPIPIPLPAFTRNLSELRSITATKVIMRTGILRTVVTRRNGASLATDDLAYDAYTGKVLVRRMENEFRQAYHTTTLPAYWFSPGMGHAMANDRFAARAVQLTGARWNAMPAGALFQGDELLLSPVDEGSTGSLRAWVYRVSGGTAWLIRASGGNDIPDGRYDLRMVRPGRQNLLDREGATLVSQRDPLPAEGGVLDLQPSLLLGAGYTAYDDLWQTDIAVRVEERSGNCTCTVDPRWEEALTGMLRTLVEVSARGGTGAPEGWSVRGNTATVQVVRENARKERVTCTITIATADGEAFPTQGIIAPGSTFSMSGCAAPTHLTRTIGGRTVNIRTDCPGLVTCAPGEEVRTSTCGEGVVNPFLNGILGNHRMAATFAPNALRTQDGHAATSGFLIDPRPVARWTATGPEALVNDPYWIATRTVTAYNSQGAPLEVRDAEGVPASTYYGFGAKLPMATAANATYSSVAFDGFEDYRYDVARLVPEGSCALPRHFHATPTFADVNVTDDERSHSGRTSAKVMPGVPLVYTPTPLSGSLSRGTRAERVSGGTFTLRQADLVRIFSPGPGTYRVSAWVHAEDPEASTFTQGVLAVDGATFTAFGPIIDGWQRIDGEFTVAAGATGVRIELRNTSAAPVWFDDLRVQPVDALVDTYVYDPVHLRMTATQDRAGHSSFFEYDALGNLERVKKETEVGVVTLREIRSALPQARP